MSGRTVRNPVAAAGYSQRPLIKKLGLKPFDRAVFSGEPASFRDALGELPPGVKVTTQIRGEKDYIHLFVKSAKILERKLGSVVRVLDTEGMAWVSWPKKSSGVPTDVSDGVVRSLGLAAGLVDVKVCAVDETWSGLKFMFRKDDRARIRAEREGRSSLLSE